MKVKISLLWMRLSVGKYLVVMFVCIILSPLLIGVVQGPSEEWGTTFGGSGVEYVSSVDQTSDSGYVFTGGTMSWGSGYMDVWLVKTDEAGNLVWNKTYGTDEYDRGFSVQQTDDDGYIITGYRGMKGYGYRDSELWLIKTYANGEMEWNKTFTEISNVTVLWSEGYSVRQTNDGGYVIAGVAQPALYVIWLIRTDSSGNKVWERVFANSNYFASSVSVQQTSDGGYILAGDIHLGYTSSNQEMLLIKTDATGVMQWNRTYGRVYEDRNGTEHAYSVQQTSDGGYIVAGRSDSSIDLRGWVVKTDSFGELVWEIVFDPYDFASAAQQTIDGGYIIFGSSRVGGRYYAMLTKLNSEGNKLSQKLVESYPYSSVRDGKQTSDGGYIIAADWTPAVGLHDVILIYTSNLFHDVAVNDVFLPKTVVGQGLSMETNVTIQNQGDFEETFNVSISANATIIQTQNIVLLNGSTITITPLWNTTGFAKGNYTISAVADTVLGEVDVADNSLTDGWIIIAMIGDITGPDGWPDGKCDMRDIGLVASHFGETVPPAPANCDVTGPVEGVPDGKINMRDIGLVASHFGDVDP